MEQITPQENKSQDPINQRLNQINRLSQLFSSSKPREIKNHLQTLYSKKANPTEQENSLIALMLTKGKFDKKEDLKQAEPKDLYRLIEYISNPSLNWPFFINQHYDNVLIALQAYHPHQQEKKDIPIEKKLGWLTDTENKELEGLINTTNYYLPENMHLPNSSLCQSKFSEDLKNGNFNLNKTQSLIKDYCQYEDQPYRTSQEAMQSFLKKQIEHITFLNKTSIAVRNDSLRQLQKDSQKLNENYSINEQEIINSMIDQNRLNCTFDNNHINELAEQLITSKTERLEDLLSNKNQQQLLETYISLCFEKWTHQATEITELKEKLPEKNALLGYILPYSHTKTTDEKGKIIDKFDLFLHDIVNKDGKKYLFIDPVGIQIPVQINTDQQGIIHLKLPNGNLQTTLQGRAINTG